MERIQKMCEKYLLIIMRHVINLAFFLNIVLFHFMHPHEICHNIAQALVGFFYSLLMLISYDYNESRNESFCLHEVLTIYYVM